MVYPVISPRVMLRDIPQGVTPHGRAGVRTPSHTGEGCAGSKRPGRKDMIMLPLTKKKKTRRGLRLRDAAGEDAPSINYLQRQVKRRAQRRFHRQQYRHFRAVWSPPNSPLSGPLCQRLGNELRSSARYDPITPISSIISHLPNNPAELSLADVYTHLS